MLSTLSSEFNNLKKNKSYGVYGDINVTITYKAMPPTTQCTYTVNKHLLDTSGKTVHTITSTLTKNKGVQITTNAPASAYYNDNSYTWVKGQSTGSFNVSSTNDRGALNGQNFNLDSNTTMDLYYQQPNYYTVTTYMFDNMDTFSTFKTMKGNVDIYFIYAAQVPITIKYVDNDTGTEIRNDTVLTLSDFEGRTRIIRSFESFKEKIADRGYITVNDIRYMYNKNAKFSNFASGNFAKSSKTLTEVGDSSITLPETGIGKSPTITLYYTPTADLTVEYRTVTEGGFNTRITSSVNFPNAIGIGRATNLGSKTEWVNAYKESMTVDGIKYTLDPKYGIEIDYTGDSATDKTVSSISTLKSTTVTPTKDTTIRIYYATDSTPKYRYLRVQRAGTDGRTITTRPAAAGRYKKDTIAKLSKLQNAAAADDSGSYNWLTNNPTESGYTLYEYAGKIKITVGNSANGEVKNFTLADVANQSVKMTDDITITIYYKPKYTLTVNYYEKDSTVPVMNSKTYTMGYYGSNFSVGSLDSSFFPETINSIYGYAGQYRWDEGNVVNGDMNQVKRLGQNPLSSNHTLTLYYEDMPSKYATIYVVDEATNTVLTTTDSIQQNAQKKLIGQLFAGNVLGNLLLNNDSVDLSNYGFGKLQYQNKYKIEERTVGQAYDPLKVPTTGIGSAGLGSIRQTSAYSKTKNYDIYLYYKRVANVEVVYVNAETGVIAGHEPVSGALIGNNFSISSSLVMDKYSMTGFSGGKTEGYLVGYNKSDNGTYDAGSAPDNYTPVNNVQQVIDSGILTKNPITGDYYVYLYYQVPYKITIHYFYNGEERTDMGKILDMTPVKNYRVPQQHVYSSLGNGKLVAWNMAGAKDVDRKLISSVQEFLNDGDAVIPNANQDTDLNLYYRYLEVPTPEPVDQSMDTTKNSDIMDDAGNLDFNSSGEIYDDASDDAVDGYSKAKTYDVARADSGIAGGDKAESAVTTLKYGYAIKYNTYTASRTFTIRIVDEIGEEIGEYSIDRSYLMNKLDEAKLFVNLSSGKLSALVKV